MSTNRKRGTTNKPAKQDQAPKGPGKPVSDQTDGDSLSEAGNNDQKVRKVGRPRKYPVGTSATSGGNTGSTPGKGSTSSSSSSSSGTTDTNKKSTPGTNDSQKKVSKVKKTVPADSKKKNVNKRALEIEDTSKKALDKLQKAKAKTKLIELKKKKQLGVGKVVGKKKTVTKVKKTVGAKKNSKDAPAKLKSKSGIGGGATSSSSSSSSKDPKTSKAKKLAQNAETENSSSKKAKKLAAKKVKLKKLTKVKTKVLNADKKKKKKKAVLVGGKVAKAKKLAQGAQASIPKQKPSKKSGQAAPVSASANDDQKKATLDLKKKPGVTKGAKRLVQKVSASGENSKITKVGKSLADKVQKMKGGTLMKMEKAKKRKEVEDPDPDAPAATSSKRKKVDSVDAKQPAVKKSKVAGQRSETPVKASATKAFVAEAVKKGAVTTAPVVSDEEKQNVLDKTNQHPVSHDTKGVEETDIPFVNKRRRLLKGSSQDEHSGESVDISPTDVSVSEKEIEKGQIKPLCTVDSLKETTPLEVDSEQGTTSCKVDSKQETAPCMVDSKQETAPCTVDSKQVTAPCTVDSKQVTAPCTVDSKQVTAPCTVDSKQGTAPCTVDNKQGTAPCTVDSKQETAPCMVDSKQETAPCTVDSKQGTAPCTVDSKQETAPCTVDSKQETAPCTVDSKQGTAPCIVDSKTDTAPCTVDSKQGTAPCTVDSKQGTAPCTVDTKTDTAPCTVDSKQGTAPCTVDSKTEIAPCTGDSKQGTAACTVDSKTDTAPCTVDSKQGTPACTVESKTDTASCTVDSKQGTAPCTVDNKTGTALCTVDTKQVNSPCKVDNKQVTTPCTVDSKDATFPCTLDSKQTNVPHMVDSKKVTAPYLVESKQTLGPCSVDSKQTTASCTVDSEKVTTPCTVDSKQVSTSCLVDSKQASVPCSVDSKQLTTPSSVDSKEVTTPCKGDSKLVSVPYSVDSKQVTTPCSVDSNKVSPCKVDSKQVIGTGYSRQVLIPGTVDNKQEMSPSKVDTKQGTSRTVDGEISHENNAQNKVDSQQVSALGSVQVETLGKSSIVQVEAPAKAPADSKNTTATNLFEVAKSFTERCENPSVIPEGRENKLNSSCSNVSKAAITLSSASESVGNVLSSFMDSKLATGSSQIDHTRVGLTKPNYIHNETILGKEKAVNTPNAENVKSTPSVPSGEATRSLQLNIFEESQTKSTPVLDKSSVLKNSDPKVFNSLDKFKSDADLAFQRFTGGIAKVQRQEKSVQNFSAAAASSQVKSVSDIVSQSTPSKKDTTVLCTEDKKKDVLLVTESGNKPTCKAAQPVVHETKLQKNLLADKTPSPALERTLETPVAPPVHITNEVTLEKQKDSKISPNNSQEKSSSTDKDLSVAATAPTLETVKGAHSEFHQKRQTLSSTDSALVSPKTSSIPLSGAAKLPISEPAKESKNLLKDFREHNSIDSNIERPTQHANKISDLEPKMILSAENKTKVSDCISAAITFPSKTSCSPRPLQKLTPEKPICPTDATIISKSVQVPAASSSSIGSKVITTAPPLTSTKQQASTVASNPLQSVSSISKDKNIFASFSDLDPSLCEKTRSVIKMAPKAETATTESPLADRNINLSHANRPFSFTLMESLSSEKNLPRGLSVTPPSSSSSSSSSSLSSSSLSSTKVSLSTSSLKSAVNALKLSHKDPSKEDLSSPPTEPAPPSSIAPPAFSPSLSLKNDISKISTANFISKILVPDKLLHKPAEVASKDDNSKSDEGSILGSKHPLKVHKEEDTTSRSENLEETAKKTSVVALSTAKREDACPNIFSKMDNLIASKIIGKDTALKEPQSEISKTKDKTCDPKSTSQIVSLVNKGAPISDKRDVGQIDVSTSETSLRSTTTTTGSGVEAQTGSGSKALIPEKEILPSPKTSTNYPLKIKTSSSSSETNKAEPASCKSSGVGSETETKPDSVTAEVGSAPKPKSESESNQSVDGSHERTLKESTAERTDSAATPKADGPPPPQKVDKETSEMKTDSESTKSCDSSGKPEQSTPLVGGATTKTETPLPSLKPSTASSSNLKSQEQGVVKLSSHPATGMETVEKSPKSINANDVVPHASALAKGESSQLALKKNTDNESSSKDSLKDADLAKSYTTPTLDTEKKNLAKSVERCAETDPKTLDRNEERLSSEPVGQSLATQPATAKPSVAAIAHESSANETVVNDRSTEDKDGKDLPEKKELAESSKNLAEKEDTKAARPASPKTTSNSQKVLVDAPSSKQDEEKPHQARIATESPKRIDDGATDAEKDAASKKNAEPEGIKTKHVSSPQIPGAENKEAADNKDQTAADKEQQIHKDTDSDLSKPVVTSSNTGACTTKFAENQNSTMGANAPKSADKLSSSALLEPPPTPYPPPYLSPKQDSVDRNNSATHGEVGNNSSSPSAVARSKVVSRPSFLVLDNCFVCIICRQMCQSKRTFHAHIWWHFHVSSKLCNHCPNMQQNADGNVGLQQRQQQTPPNKCPYVMDVMLKICRARKKMHRLIVRSDADQSDREKTFAEVETDTESVDLDYELDNGGSGGGGDSFGGKPASQSLLSTPRGGGGQDTAQSEKDGKTYTDLTDDNNSIFAPANVDYLRSLYSSGSKKRNKKSSSASNAQNHHHPHHHHRHHHHSSSSSSSSSTSSSLVTTSASAAAQKKGSFYVCGFQYCTYSCMNCLQFRLHLQQCHNFETVFPCYHCGQTNYSKDDLIKHMYNHSNARDFLLFRCSFPRCRFGTNMLQEFHEHNNIFHVGELVFTCFYCSTEFSELSQLLAHLQSNLLKFVQCPHCTVKDRNRRTVLNHISTEHPLKPKQIVVTSQVVCKKKQTVSPDQSSEHSHQQQQLNLHRSLSEDRILECIKCGLLCRNIATLRRHSRVCLKDALSHKKSFASSPKENHWTLVYSCQWCSFPASSDTMLFQHTVDQHPGKNANFEQIELKISGSSGNGNDSRLSTSSWLEAAKSGAFICPYCKVAFHNERNWSDHMEREHNGDEHDLNSKRGLDGDVKYPCDFCEFNGTSEQDLHEHQQIMTATEGPDGMHRKVVDLANITPKVTLLTDTKLTVSNVLSFKRFKRSPSKKMNNAYFKCSGCHFRSLSKWQSLRHVKHCSLAKRRLSEYIRKRSTMGNGGTDEVKIEPVDPDLKPLEIDEEPSSSPSPSSDRPKTALEDADVRNVWNTKMMSYMRDKQMNLMAKEGILDCTETEGYRCSICRHTGKTMINIRQHLWKTHLKLKPVHCPCCPFTSWKNYTLEKHKISKHHHSHPNLSDYEMKTLAQNLQGTTDGLVECQLCFYKSPSSYKVRTHIWRTHMHLEMKQCSLCAYKCWYLYLMNMHQLSRHKTDKLRAVDGKPTKTEMNVDDDDDDDDSSKQAKTSADNICNLLGNSSSMSDEDMSLSAKGLMEKKSGNKYECCVCRYECTRIMIMKIHIWKRHLNIQQRRCPRCPYICWLQSRLQQHICRIGTSCSSKSNHDDGIGGGEASTMSAKESKSRWVISKADEFGCKLYINKTKRPQKRLSMDESGQPTPKKFRSMSDGGTVTHSGGGGGGGGRGATTTTNFSKGSKNFSWIRHTWENSVTQSFFRVGCRKLFARTTDRVNQMEIFTCVYCSYKSWNMEAMCHHSYKHKLQCGYCLFRAYSRKKIMEHIDEFHQAPPKIIRDENYKKYRMVFPSLGATRDKMRSKGSTERQRRRRRTSGSTRSSNVINLDDSEESDLDSESTSDWRPSSDSEDDQEEECVTRYCCCHCSMRTHDFDRFRKHIAKHSRSAEDLQCPTCVYRTRDAYKFQQHIRRHPSEHFCGYCNFSSMQESFVQLHVRRVHPKKPVQIHIRSQTIAAAAAANSGRTLASPSATSANFNVRVILQDFLALDTVDFETILKTNVVHSLDLENIILEEDKLLSVL